MRRVLVLAAIAAALLAEAAPPRRTARAPAPAAKESARRVSPFRRSPYIGAISVDANTGRVLFADQADAQAYPASITKLMTAYLVLDDVKAGKLSLSTPVEASPVKSRLDSHLRQPSCIGLKAGQKMSVRDLLTVLLVHSANDAAIFLAEKCSGSMQAFVARMNEKAASLGMGSTRYYNPNGLPPLPYSKGGKFNISTCRDLSRLAINLLKDHPDILEYTSIKVCEVDHPDGKRLKFVNHNNVMVKDRLKVINPDGSEAADGLKTGYIDAGGSSVILTGKRGNKRAIVVVLGSSSAAERDAAAAQRLEDALDALAM